jgi:dTDP-4-dehydrorhamnose 3,5-epimerase
MKIYDTPIKDLLIIENDIFEDNRGWFCETYNKNTFIKNGLTVDFIQDNHSFSSKKGVLRGLHFQNEPFSQAKLVRCIKGKIWDVAVDLRKSSSTYKQWFGLELSSKNHKMLLIPKGFAHGFLTLQDHCEVQYKVDNIYNKESERTIKYDDSEINVYWPIDEVTLSEKDKYAPLLKNSDVNFK